jgi:hypothetical protein
LDELESHPGVWYFATWDELPTHADHPGKIKRLKDEADYRSWVLMYQEVSRHGGGVFVRRAA